MSVISGKVFALVKQTVDTSVSGLLTLESLLLEEKMMDSFGLIQLIAEIEDEFSISMDIEDLTSQNFASVNDIVTLVEGYIKEKE